jgi:hypothetical protein
MSVNSGFIMNAAISNKQSSEEPNVWKKSEGTFSADAVIDAYLKGIEVGKNEYTRVLMLQFKENMTEAGKATERLLLKATEHNIKVKSVHLRADSISAFTALFIVDEKDFLDDSFRPIFTDARNIKNEFIKETFYISFTFLPSPANLKESSLTADGYSWNYAKS